jgi:hypothetical protein
VTLRCSHKQKRFPATLGMRSQLASPSTLKPRSSDRYRFLPTPVNRFTFGRSGVAYCCAMEGLSMTVKSTAFYAVSFGLLTLLAMLIWASAPDIALALFAAL